MAWGAAEWGAVATAAAGFMALGAAWWTVRATREAAAENSRLLKEQIKIQSDELSELRSATLETYRRDKLHAAYIIYRLAGDTCAIIQNAAEDAGGGLIIPIFPRELILRLEAAYPLQSFLNRENHILFQYMDAILHGEPVSTPRSAAGAIENLHLLRKAMTPAIVSLPKGNGDRVYGYGNDGLMEADGTADI